MKYCIKFVDLKAGKKFINMMKIAKLVNGKMKI